MVKILKQCDENNECIFLLQFLAMVLQTAQSELWTSIEDDKYHSLPKYRVFQKELYNFESV